MNTQQAVLTIVVAACFFLSVVALSRGGRGEGNKIFGLMTFLAGCWAMISFFEEERIIFYVKILLVRADFFTALILSILFLSFSQTFAKSKLGIRLQSTLLCLNIATAILTLTPLIISGVLDKGGGQISIMNGVLFVVYAVVIFLNFFLGIYALVAGYLKSEGAHKRQLFYVSLGLVLTIVIAVSTNIVVPQFLKVSSLVPRIGIYSMLIYLATTTFAITQHGLFNIKVIATQLFVGLLLLAILGRILTSDTTLDIVYESILFSMSLLFGFFLVRSVNSEVSRREEVETLAKEKTTALGELEERNKNLATLQRISDIVLNESEMKAMTQKILDEIPRQLDSCAGALLSVVTDSQLVAYALSEHQFSHKILSLVGGDLGKYSHPVKKDYSLMHAVLVDKEPHDSDSLSDFISPPISKAVALTIQKMIGARHIEAFPLYAGGEPFGVLMFVFTQQKDLVHEKNHSIAKAIADDMSLAIQRAQAYTKLKEANAYLADLDKLKDEFISMASHELNTPLAAIEGYLSMVLDEGMGKIDPKAKEYLNRAYDSSKRLAELILDLLNVSRIEQGRLKMKFAKTNFAQIVESVIKELQLKADTKKIYLKLEAPKTDLPETFCDPDRIREVFVNLIGNSIKFTEKGGITVKLSHPDDHIRAEVVDTGRGIATEDQNKLFQKFSQVKREIDEHQGTGLGLYISKNFVELHKGTIGVKSEVGKGATFFFEIPILKSAPKEVAGAILDKPVSAAQIESGPKGVPSIVTESTKVKV